MAEELTPQHPPLSRGNTPPPLTRGGREEFSIGIIGGGYAGMAAAVSLAARGIPVTVFESAQQLGGRARGVMYNETQLDNGQHLLLGCYRHTLQMIEQVGGNIENDFLRLPLQLDLHGQFSLKAPHLPAPLHLLVALLKAHGLTWNERLKAARFMLALRRINFTLPSHAGWRGAGGRGGEFAEHALRPSSGSGVQAGMRTASEGSSDITVAELLTRYRQDADLTFKLWEPLCIAALNTPIHKASAQVLLNVLRDALNQSRADSDMLLPRLDFTTLFPQRAASYVEQRDGKVLTSCGVEAIAPKNGRIELATVGGTHTFSHVICATSPAVAAKLLRPIAALAETVSMIDAIEHQPIYTVYLQYSPAAGLPHPMIGLHQRYSQWLFDKGKIARQHGLIAAVISAEGIHQELPQEELAQKVIAELREEFGITEQPQWFKVIAEKRATFCCSPSLRRPTQQTPLPGIFLAGDYTAGDYPATLEGAVMSGVKCAAMIGE